MNATAFRPVSQLNLHFGAQSDQNGDFMETSVTCSIKLQTQKKQSVQNYSNYKDEARNDQSREANGKIVWRRGACKDENQDESIILNEQICIRI